MKIKAITGANGSGKTTWLRRIKKETPSCPVFHLDNILVKDRLTFLLALPVSTPIVWMEGTCIGRDLGYLQALQNICSTQGWDLEVLYLKATPEFCAARTATRRNGPRTTLAGITEQIRKIERNLTHFQHRVSKIN